MDDIDTLIENLDDGKNLPFTEAATKESHDPTSKTVPEELLKTDVTIGLTNAEVTKRSRTYGDNELSEKKEPNFFKKILVYFRGPVQYVMIAAALLAVGLQEWIDLGIIAALLCLNASVG
jgi:H+-transporting ATPase